NSVTFSGLTIANGNAINEGAGGGVFVGHGATVANFSDCRFTGNSDNHQRSGGAGVFDQASSSAILNCSFIGNDGGPRATEAQTLDMESSTFTGNVGERPTIDIENGSTTITGCNISGNTYGGIFEEGGLTTAVAISTTTISNNNYSSLPARVRNWGGGIYNN